MENIQPSEQVKPQSPREFPTFYVIGTLAVLFLITSVILTIRNFNLSKDLKSLKNKLQDTENSLNSEKEIVNQLEKELIFYKNTDLAKEVELLQLKLESKEKELNDAKRELLNTQGKLTNLEANNQKVKPYLDAVDAIEAMLSEGPKAGNVSNVDSKISALKDSDVSNQWAKARASIDLEKASWSGSDVSATVTLITSRILALVQ